MEREALYGGFLQDTGPLNSGGIEGLLHLPSYGSLEMQAAQNMPLFGEIEDPPETCHTPWGVWLHHRDPLHSIDQRYDTAHLIRTGMAAEDILHYAHYVPVIGEHNNKIESYEISFKYDYSHEEPVYNVDIKEDIEETEITNTDDFEEGFKFDDNKGVEQDEAESLPEDKNQHNANFESDMELMKIFENIVLEKIKA